jgi:hypothetical protein
MVGEEAIYTALTDYRDAIQFVHDQTVRLMNTGLPLDEIVERVRLPAHLADKPYLREYYGHVDWSGAPSDCCAWPVVRTVSWRLHEPRAPRATTSGRSSFPPS